MEHCGTPVRRENYLTNPNWLSKHPSIVTGYSHNAVGHGLHNGIGYLHGSF